MDLREHQAPLKQRYRQEPGAARITLTARGSETDAPVGAGTAACSGDLLLGALAAREEQLEGLMGRTERYCTVLQTLTGQPRVTTELQRGL